MKKPCSLFRVLIPAVAALISMPATADQIVLKNGDRITGQIKLFYDQEITIEPEYSDEFQVDLEAVAYVNAPREFEIELQDGRELVASFEGADEDGNQIVIVEGRTVTVPLMQVAELDEPEEYFDWSTMGDVNYTLDQGNTEAENLKITGNATLKVGDHKHIFDLWFAREEQNKISTKEQDLFRYNWNWALRDPWFFATIASFERDPIRDLDYRWSVAPALGYSIWDDPRRLFNIQVATGYQEEKIGGLSEESATLGWLMRFKYELASIDMEFYNDNSYVANMTGRDNQVLKTITGMRYEITDTLYLNFQVAYDRESQPAPGAEKDDLSVLFGVGVEFDK